MRIFGALLCLVGLRSRPVEPSIIHLVDFATQPDIRFACDRTWSEPSWDTKKQRELPSGIYLAENGRTYAFDAEKVTCKWCKRRTVNRRLVEHRPVEREGSDR